jgi:G3E family GTPase
VNAPRARLPLTVIGGFLGAGKTTLLGRLLHASQGRRFAVLVNDFGALNIDARLIAARGADAIALSNGCVCCSIGGDLTDALIRVLASPGRFDAVVIEASGVADPWRIAQVGAADPGLSLDGMIVLVDAAAVLEQAADPLLTDTLQRQLRGADLVVINKADLADDAQRRRVHEWVASVAGPTPCIETVQAAVPMALLTGAAMPAHEAAHGAVHEGEAAHEAARPPHAGHDHGSAGHAELFETWSCRPGEALPAQALREWLRGRPAGVLRLKGMVRTDAHGWAEIQFAGRHGSLRRALAEPAQGAAVVAIGLRGHLPVAQLEHVFGSPRTD